VENFFIVDNFLGEKIWICQNVRGALHGG